LTDTQANPNSTGAASQNDIGTGCGMISATALAIFFVPLFYEIVRDRLG
jgi:multidrug efflux pump subunit AcrB